MKLICEPLNEYNFLALQQDGKLDKCGRHMYWTLVVSSTCVLPEHISVLYLGHYSVNIDLLVPLSYFSWTYSTCRVFVGVPLNIEVWCCAWSLSSTQSQSMVCLSICFRFCFACTVIFTCLKSNLLINCVRESLIMRWGTQLTNLYTKTCLLRGMKEAKLNIGGTCLTVLQVPMTLLLIAIYFLSKDTFI